nr:MAG TPA: hypothetical protein [Crassvirales sp.]
MPVKSKQPLMQASHLLGSFAALNLGVVYTLAKRSRTSMLLTVELEGVEPSS